MPTFVRVSIMRATAERVTKLLWEPVSIRMATLLPLISPSMIGMLRSMRTGHSSMRISLHSGGAAITCPAASAASQARIHFLMGRAYSMGGSGKALKVSGWRTPAAWARWRGLSSP